MANPSKFTWTDPVTNVDGSAITAGEITGYSIGVRLASGSPGTYTIVTPIASPAASSEPLAALSSVLAPGSYAAAIQTVGPVNSAWSAEITFTIAPPTPNPPTGFTAS
jgi:hypothetical protein